MFYFFSTFPELKIRQAGVWLVFLLNGEGKIKEKCADRCSITPQDISLVCSLGSITLALRNYSNIFQQRKHILKF